MTVFTQANAAPAQYVYIEGLNPQLPNQLRAGKEPRKDKRVEYVFPQILFPLDGGKTLLRLHSPPILQVDNKSLEFDVEGWGIRMKCGEVYDLPRQIARRFIYLFGRSEQQILSDEERVQWVGILDRIDSNQFSYDRSAPRYNEGVLMQRDPILVEWSDGKTERINPVVGAAFLPLEPGDLFSAYIKLGRDNKTLDMDRVTLITVGEQSRC